MLLLYNVLITCEYLLFLYMQVKIEQRRFNGREHTFLLTVLSGGLEQAPARQTHDIMMKGSACHSFTARVKMQWLSFCSLSHSQRFFSLSQAEAPRVRRSSIRASEGERGKTRSQRKRERERRKMISASFSLCRLRLNIDICLFRLLRIDLIKEKPIKCFCLMCQWESIVAWERSTSSSRHGGEKMGRKESDKLM